MKKILVITSTPTENFPRGSISLETTNQFLEVYKKSNPTDEISFLNLNSDSVGTNTLTSGNIGDFYNYSDKYIDQLKNIDKLIIGVPVINLNYSATLKNYLDCISVSGKTFKFTKEGKLVGLLTHLKLKLIFSQGSMILPIDVAANLEENFKLFGAKVSSTLKILGTDMPENEKFSAKQIVENNLGKITSSANQF